MRRILLILFILSLPFVFSGCLDKIPIIGDLFKSYPDIEGNWLVTVNLNSTTCPPEALDFPIPYQEQLQMTATQDDEEIILRFYSEEEEFITMKGTIDKDGEFEASAVVQEEDVKREYYAKGTFDEDSMEAELQIEYTTSGGESCVVEGTMEGTKQ